MDLQNKMFNKIINVFMTILPKDIVIITKEGGAYVLEHKSTWFGKTTSNKMLIKKMMEKYPEGFEIV